MPQPNIGTIFDYLCYNLARNVIDGNEEGIRQVRSAVRSHFRKNCISEELKLYNLVIYNSFESDSVAQAFVVELLNQCKKIDQDSLIQEAAKLHDQIGDVGFKSEYDELYGLLAESFSQYRAGDKSSKFYRNVDMVVKYLVSKTCNAQVQESYLPAPTKKKLPKIVLKIAVENFNKKYANLTSTQKEILSDYMYYRSHDRLKKSLVGRLEEMNEELIKFARKTDISNAQELKRKIDDYVKHIAENDEPVTDIVYNACEIAGLVDDFGKINSAE